MHIDFGLSDCAFPARSLTTLSEMAAHYDLMSWKTKLTYFAPVWNQLRIQKFHGKSCRNNVDRYNFGVLQPSIAKAWVLYSFEVRTGIPVYISMVVSRWLPHSLKEALQKSQLKEMAVY